MNYKDDKNALEELDRMRVDRTKQELTLSTLRKKKAKVGIKQKPKVEEQKPKLNVMQRFKESEAKSEGLKSEIEKRDTLQRIEQMYKDKIKGGNQLIQDFEPKFEKILTELHKEINPVLKAEEDSIKFKEDRLMRRIDRHRTQGELDTRIKNQLQWLNMDIKNSFESKLALVQGIDINDVEMVTKIRYYNEKVEYETDNGVYEFTVEEAQKFGGYVIQQVRILTEELKLHSIMKGMVSRTPAISNRFKNLFWLMVEPFLAFTEEGKVLILDTSHLIESMHDNFKTRVANPNFNTKEIDVFQDSRKALFLEDRKIIEYIDKNLKIPQTNMAVTFPYHLLEKSGVEFELKYKAKNKESITDVTLPQGLVRFISLEEQALREESNEMYYYYKRAYNDLDDLYEKILIGSTKPPKVETDRKDAKSKAQRKEEQDRNDMMQSVLDDMEEKESNYQKKLSKEVKIKMAVEEDINKEKEEEENENKERELKQELIDNISLKDINYIEVDKQFKLFIERMEKFDHTRVSEIGLTLDKYIGTEINLDVTLDMVERSLVSVLNTKVKVNNFINEINETAGEYRKEINDKIAGEVDRNNQSIREYIKYVQDLNKAYKDIRKKYESVNSALYRHIPVSLGNLDATIESEQGYPINLAPMLIDKILLDPDIFNEIDIANKYARPVINNPRKMMYNYMRDMVKFFREREIHVVNWLELLKVMIPENVSYLSQIRNCPEIQKLVQCEKIIPLLVLVDKLKKVRSVDEDVEWEDVRDRKTGYLPITTEAENKFNLVMSDIFTHHLGFMCAIDFENLINYIVNLDDIREMEGKELVKHIPLPQVIDRYFHIQGISLQYPKLRPSLFTEIRTVPTVIVALQHILFTGRDYISSYTSTEDFIELERMAIEYGVQKKKIYDKDLRKKSNTINTVAIRIQDLNVEYRKLDEIVKKNYNKDFGLVELDLSNYREFKEYRDQLEEWGDAMERNNPTLYKEINRLRNELDREIRKHEEGTRFMLKGAIEELDTQVKESLEKIREHKENITNQKTDYMENTLKVINNYYDYDKSYEGLLNAIGKFNLDYIPSTGVLVNLIKNMADELPKPLSGALLQVASDFILTLKSIEDSNPFKTSKAKALTTVQIFNVITQALGVNSPLSPSAKDIDKLEERFQEEYDKAIEDNKPDMTDEEKEELTKFLNGLNSLRDYDIPAIVKGYKRKDLIPATLYEELAYPNNQYYGEGYEDLYSEDFSLTENLKMRKEVGLEIKPEHLNDHKLMEIVDSIVIEEKFINTLKEV